MSVSVQPAAGPSAWRLAVIGAVVLLAVAIGAALGTFLLSDRAAGVGGGAAYVPADAPFYVEMRLDPSVGQDAALRELLGRFPPIDGLDLARPLYAQLGERLDEMLAGEQPSVSWGSDVAPWFDGRVAFALTELPASLMAPPADPMAAPEIPPMLVLVGVTDPAAARDSLDRLADAGGSGQSYRELDHAGVTIRVADAPDSGAYAVTDDQLLLAPTSDDIVAALDARASGVDSLGSRTDVSRFAAALPADWLAFAVYDLTDFMTAAIDEAGGQTAAMSSALAELIAHQPMRGAMAVTATGDRLAMDGASDPPTGPLAIENADRRLAAEVPADALYYAEAGNLGSVLAAWTTSIKEAASADPAFAEGLREAEAALGTDLEELVSWIDDGAMVIGWDGSEPYGGMLLVPDDRAAAERRLGQLATFAGLAALDPSSGLSVAEAEVGSVTVTTIRWEEASPDPAPMFPAPTSLVVEYALTDDRAIIGLGDAFVGRVLELDEGDALAAEPRFSAAIGELGGTSNAGLTWMDLAGTLVAVEAALDPMLGAMEPGGAYASEIRPWLLPLDRIVSVARVEGDLLVQRMAILVE